MHLPDLESVNYTLGLLGIVAIVVGWWRGWWESPKRRQEREQRELERARQQAVAEAILGEPESRDLAGKIIRPAQPGLVSRTATLEQAVATLVNQDARIAHLESDVDMLKKREMKDVVQAAERVATAEVATAALNLIRDEQTINAEQPPAETIGD